MFFKTVSMKLRRHLLVACLVLCLSAFIFTYLSLRHTIYNAPYRQNERQIFNSSTGLKNKGIIFHFHHPTIPQKNIPNLSNAKTLDDKKPPGKRQNPNLNGEKVVGELVNPKGNNEKVVGELVNPKGNNEKVVGELVNPKGNIEKVVGELVNPKGNNEKVVGELVNPKGNNDKVVGEFFNQKHLEISTKERKELSKVFGENKSEIQREVVKKKLNQGEKTDNNDNELLNNLSANLHNKDTSIEEMTLGLKEESAINKISSVLLDKVFRKDEKVSDQVKNMTISKTRQLMQELIKEKLKLESWQKHSTQNLGKIEDDEEKSEKLPKRGASCNGCFKVNYKFLHTPKTLCRKNHSVDLLILISSDPNKLHARMAVRQTWGEICNTGDSRISCAFMVGLSEDNFLNANVRNESLKYRDIIIFSHLDSYENLTLKSIMGLKWSQKFCKQAKYIMKTDEDVYVNTRLIPTMLRAAPTKQFYGGYCWGLSIPKRDFTLKWHISYESYPDEFLPPMCSGTGYILTPDVITSILQVHENIPFIYLEDVYIAVCVRKVGGYPVNIAGFNNMRTPFEACAYRNFVLTSHQISETELIDFWEMANECPAIPNTPDTLYQTLLLPDLTQ